MQPICVKYEAQDNKPPNHDVRMHFPCGKFFHDCEMNIQWRMWQGETIACDINKVRNIKTAVDTHA